MDDIIVIDSDDDDLDRKPAAKKSGDDSTSKKISARNLGGVECISLVDDEDKKISADDIDVPKSNEDEFISLLDSGEGNLPKSNEDEFISLLDSGEGMKKSAMATNSDDPCVSLLDSSDEENFDNSGSYGMLSPKSRKRRRAEEADRKLAQQLQAQEDKAGTKANSRKEKKAMAKSTDGKSVLAVQQIIALVKTAKDKYIDNNVGLHQHIHANNMNPAYMRAAASAATAGGGAGSSTQETIEAVTIDDMVFFCKNMLDKQTEMIENDVSGYIDIGYHYTDHRNMDNIRTHGLMTKAERTQGNVVAASKGAVFGDGIYTANNCKNFSNFGPAGLIVARLQGKAVRAASYLPPSKLTGIEAHTIIGDKMTGAGSGVDKDSWPTSDSYHEIVLRHSSQCLPMIKFDRALISSKDGEACLQFIEKSLIEIINKLFNKGIQPNNVCDAPFIVPPVQRRYPAVPAAPPSVPLPPGGRLPPSLPASLAARMGLLPGVTGAPLPLPGVPGSATGSIGFAPPPSVGAWKRRKKTSSSTAAASMANARSYTAPMTTQTLTYTGPISLNVGVPDNALTPVPTSCNLDDDCVICMEKLKKRRKCAALPCKHVFHKQCLELAFKSKPQCPVCRISIGQAQGKSPSGTMTVFVSPRCSGFNEDSITITYNMPSGTQMSYHDNPNTRHSSKFVSAYLPNNSDGRELLKRLKFAFMHGLTFTVGTSATSGQTNQITWSSVHHKTAPSGGVHGFPDPNYFTNCHGELDGLNVPSPRDLDNEGKKISG